MIRKGSETDFGMARIRSDWFLTDFYQTRHKTLFGLVRNDSERFRNIFRNGPDSFGLIFDRFLSNAMQTNFLNWFGMIPKGSETDFGMARIRSDWFLTVLHQTRYKTFFRLVRNDSERFRNRFRNGPDSFGLIFYRFTWNAMQQHFLNWFGMIPKGSETDFVMARFHSDWFLTDFYQTRYKTFFRLVRNDFERFRNRFRNGPDSFGLIFDCFTPNVIQNNFLNWFGMITKGTETDFGMARIRSDWFLTVLNQTRYKTIFQIGSEWIPFRSFRQGNLYPEKVNKESFRKKVSRFRKL